MLVHRFPCCTCSQYHTASGVPLHPFISPNHHYYDARDTDVNDGGDDDDDDARTSDVDVRVVDVAFHGE